MTIVEARHRRLSILPPPESVWWRALAMCIVLGQALWALAIPIKNVVVMSYPSFMDDIEETITNVMYPGFNHSMPTHSGPQVLQLAQEVLELSVGDSTIHRRFEEEGDFIIDDLESACTQTSTRRLDILRRRKRWLPSTRHARRRSSSRTRAPTKIRPTITLTCSSDKAVLQGMLCTDGVTNGPYGDSSFDNGQPKNLTTLKPINLAHVVGDQAGWQNSVGLITFIDFFHQMMRQVFAKLK
ncbi:TPA: hypothetical protein N0F65_000099 [Lagenidium giganteum]|uniref:Uncharacterized protein n=1 Tax=Lagenidium giganteum TaxID=4803 RepID=A0AAV2YQ82_9STRA|nr:TPA: hypothetical protein N0F65_000099 [Lagenidium giganteum]